MVSLNEVGQRGVDHQFFVSAAHKGPFIKTAPSSTATYPALWNHDAKNETRLACLPDSQMLVRSGMEKDAEKLWEVASRSHITQEFSIYISTAVRCSYGSKEYRWQGLAECKIYR